MDNVVFYDCCILAFEGRGANWRLPFLPVEKVQVFKAVHPSQLCPLCALSGALCGFRQLLSCPFPWLVETTRSVSCPSYCPGARGECTLLEAELGVLWVVGIQCWSVPSDSHRDVCVHSPGVLAGADFRLCLFWLWTKLPVSLSKEPA